MNTSDRDDGDAAQEVAAAFANVARVLVSEPTLTDLLARIAHLAVATVDGCRYAGIMSRNGEHIAVVAVSEPQVREIDNRQITDGEGPCIDAMNRNATVYAADLHGRTPWPRFAPHALEAGIGSILSMPLGEPDPPSALNMYAELPNAYDATARAQAAIFAAHGGVALAAQRRTDAEHVQADQLREALVTRQLIGQAQGILMGTERITADEAFDVLRTASQHLNIKLRDIAQRLVDTGERPETGKRKPS